MEGAFETLGGLVLSTIDRGTGYREALSKLIKNLQRERLILTGAELPEARKNPNIPPVSMATGSLVLPRSP